MLVIKVKQYLNLYCVELSAVTISRINFPVLDPKLLKPLIAGFDIHFEDKIYLPPDANRLF